MVNLTRRHGFRQGRIDSPGNPEPGRIGIENPDPVLDYKMPLCPDRGLVASRNGCESEAGFHGNVRACHFCLYPVRRTGCKSNPNRPASCRTDMMVWKPVFWRAAPLARRIARGASASKTGHSASHMSPFRPRDEGNERMHPYAGVRKDLQGTWG